MHIYKPARRGLRLTFSFAREQGSEHAMTKRHEILFSIGFPRFCRIVVPLYDGMRRF